MTAEEALNRVANARNYLSVILWSASGDAGVTPEEVREAVRGVNQTLDEIELFLKERP